MLKARVRSLRLPKEPVRGAGRGSWVSWLLCALLAGTTAYLGYRAYRQDALVNRSAGEANDSTGQASEAAVPVANTPGSILLESKGYIVPFQQILVSPKVSGMIQKLFITEGQRVKKDEVLAKVEDVDYHADHERARAFLEAARQRRAELQAFLPEEIGQARAELAEAEEQLKQFNAVWERAKTLLKSSAISQETYDDAESKALAMDRRVARLRFALKLLEDGPRRERREAAAAEVQQAEAELLKAKWRLDNCEIRAPVSGTILKKNAEEGNIVNPIAFNGSFSICEMADLSDLEVDLTIQERDISKIFPQQRCEVRAEAYPERTYHGFVSRLMPIADRAKGAVPVRVKLRVPKEEEGVYLKPEMGALVSFFNGKTE